MASIRGILNIFSRETRRQEAVIPAADDLITLITEGPDPHVIDMALQQAGYAPFWPQTPRMTQFYHAALTDRRLASRLKAVADLGMAARRHALAHLQMAPDPLAEAQLAARHFALVHISVPDPALPDASRSYLRRLRQPQSARVMGNSVAQDILGCFGGDITRALASGQTPDDALRALLREQLIDMLRAWLRAAAGGALPARLDAAIQKTVTAPDCFAHLRVEIAASPQLDAAARSGGMLVADLVAILLTRIKDIAIEPLLVCRDDRMLIQRGFGDRRQVTSHVLRPDAAMAADLERLAALFETAGAEARDAVTIAAADDTAQCAGLARVSAEAAPAQLGDCQYAYEALGEIALFAQGYGAADGNRGLRHYWQRHEDAGLTSRIGTQLGLVLGDLQTLYEQLTRRDVYTLTPDVRRLQDRMHARPITAAHISGGEGNDSA